MYIAKMIITHRGRNTNFRENTISSFEEALKLGCEAVECDLRLTLNNNVVVCHNRDTFFKGKKIAISKTPPNILNGQKLLTIENLFEYIDYKNIPFYLELKNSSLLLVERVIEKIQAYNLWERVYVMGFSFFINNAIGAQSKYPKLKVIQLMGIPFYSYIKKLRPSYGVAFGWFDEWFGSEWLFRKLISAKRLAKLKKLYKRNGFKKIMAGVINTKEGFEYFEQAGITDIITDNVPGATAYFRHKRKNLVKD